MRTWEWTLGAGKVAWSRGPTEATSQIDRRKDQDLLGLEFLAFVSSPEDTGIVSLLEDWRFVLSFWFAVGYR
jgi:hypothetical protein